MAPVIAHGEPLEVDQVLRPMLGFLRWVVGLTVGALFWCMGWLWWVPVPLVVATLAMEGVLLFRSDRAIRLTIGPDRIVSDDRFAPTLTVRADDIHTCVILERPRGPGHEAVVVLGSTTRPLMALAFQLDAPLGRGVEVDAIDAHLQAGAGVLRSVAPGTRTLRQRFHDRKALDALLALVPEAATHRIGLRLWRGAAPELTVFGHHATNADAWMVVEGDRYRVTDPGGEPLTEGALRLDGVRTARRDALLLRVAGAEGPDLGTLPLLVLDLDGLSLAIPAPARSGEAVPADEALVHTHAPEAAALLARLHTDAEVPPPWAGDTAQTPPGAPAA